MRLLMLGGSGFVGRAIVNEALSRDWDVTLLHRGNRRPPSGATVLQGDRTAPDGAGCPARTTW